MELINLEDIKIETIKLEAITNSEIKSYYKYSGELNKDNLPHGYGTAIFRNYKYTGEWKNGLQCGNGIKSFIQNGLNIKFVGIFEGLSIKEKGFIIINNNLYYKGYFLNNKFNGKGKMYFNKDKIKCIGNWKNGLKNGFFKEYDIDNNIIYEGYYIDNKKEGMGSLFDKNFSKLIPIYSGNWLNNKYDGVGKLYIKLNNENNYYIGDFKEGLKEGKGELYENNTLYEGYFKNNMKEGEGILYICKDYKSLKTLKYELKYEGIFKNDKLDGNGKCYYKNNDIYEGQFVNNLKEGFGIYIINKTKVKYEGNWLNDKRNGNGIITDENGNMFKTIWKNDKKISNKRYKSEFEDDDSNLLKKIRYSIPKEFKCPITCDLMLNPVIASDGHTYDLKSLNNLFKTKKDVIKSPLTREILNKNIKISNINLKKLIDDMLKEYPLILHM
jgi:hypothetical protein|tara:strand:- start:12471 stop:13793 length:1323 start_codon:yes stop_codon:yes gene_type:complete